VSLVVAVKQLVLPVKFRLGQNGFAWPGGEGRGDP